MKAAGGNPHPKTRSEQTMKRVIGACVAILCMFLFIPYAHAEEVRIDITANPTELVEDGQVTFTFSINNYNENYPMTDVLIAYNGADYDLLDGMEIGPGEQVSNISLTLDVSASQLGSPIVFTLNWTRNGEPMSQDATITVERAENPVIEVTRTADKENAKPGEEIVLTIYH